MAGVLVAGQATHIPCSNHLVQGGPLLVINGVITLLIGGIAPFITDKG